MVREDRSLGQEVPEIESEPPEYTSSRLSLSFGLATLQTLGEEAQKAHRVELPRMLEVQQGRAWHDIVTLGDSWFYLSTDHKPIRLPRDETVPECEGYIVQSKS
jgi:hypothetical protein